MTLDDDIIIRLIKLPLDVHGFVLRSSDSCYNIYLNRCLSYEQRQKTLQHELEHIFDDDLSCEQIFENVEGT